MDFSEKWGTDVEEAVRLALIDLKLTRDEVDVTVLEQPSKGFFGLGSKLAKVRVEKKKAPKEEKPERPAEVQTPKEERTAAAAPVKKPENREVKENRENRNPRGERNASSRREEKRPPRRERKIERISESKPENLEPVTDHPGVAFLNEVAEKMGLTINVTAAMNEDCIYIDIDGKDSGTIIGKRGQTLDAIQYLTSLVVNKGDGKYMRVVVDAESYRAKRERTLEQLADRLADKVVRTRKSVRLEPMNPYERKVIHATLQSNPNVTTRSEGEEPYRRVIIELK